MSIIGRNEIAARFTIARDASDARSQRGGAIEKMLEPEEVAELAVPCASDPGGTTMESRYRFAVSVCGGFIMH
jgi:hypothetical protein